MATTATRNARCTACGQKLSVPVAALPKLARCRCPKCPNAGTVALEGQLVLHGQPAFVGDRESVYGGAYSYSGRTATHAVTGGRALCGLEGFASLEPMAEGEAFVECLRCRRALAKSVATGAAQPVAA